MPTDIEKLEDSPHLLDLLIQMEDVLDSLDVYVFKNWIDGEIVEGPMVRRYWLDMTLKYDLKKMPDPRAGLRLLKHGVRVDFSKAHEEASGQTKDLDETEVDSEGKKIWLVRISIPRRLIAELNAGQLDFYDEEIDADDVQDAQDGGMNDESGYDEEAGGADPNAPPGMDDPMAGPGGAPPAPGGAPPPAAAPKGGPNG
ncbi:MAG: hypothetical protein EOO77_25460 [Oxalobacteraceae bacterium]|nr:MAG: hypothetical protein EOO77_25460 [Oxalobacteraceae bacterium]